ncbi:protein-export chaperone SecB [Zavarzinia aquatilis]|uniref:Protein-export protein SecB n=1 Tax=Zavarzinia aquatilis TaxID=2211142 RepID=A0A317E645_9PROT|nr:protein-export chaperone SecB [Zavarzinia aquatilis]PWR22487.1 protein-export chaperone SecB [Zavarzinia aquatilis]
MTDTEAATPDQAQANPVQFSVIAQYVRDISFENPAAPGSLALGQQPKIDIGVDVQARRLQDDRFEVELRIRANATDAEGKPVFVVELVYCGLFLVRNVPADALQPLCLIECPRVLFPFARRIIADLTRDGGFPPLMLDPIDFVALYRQHLARAQAQSQAAQQQ